MGNTSPTDFTSALPKAAQWSLSGTKRLLDFACAAMLVTATAPLMVILAILVKVSSAGPFLFQQNRIGQNGKEFPVLKFRTMHSSTGHGSGAPITRSGDCRVTSVGSWLRKWKLDELPQLVNVLRGDMSLVGYRPDMLKYMQTLIEPESSGGQNGAVLCQQPAAPKDPYGSGVCRACDALD
jgi:lipopolysaccharide/colanic/teichoic acid biosynthesis glycosyltransferase